MSKLKLKVHGDRIYIYLRPKEDSTGTKKCEKCQGTGKIGAKTCLHCNGKGEVMAIALSENANQRFRIGEILDVGEQVQERGVYKVGDTVGINIYAGVYLEAPAYGMRDERHKVVVEEEILGHVKIEEEHLGRP